MLATQCMYCQLVIQLEIQAPKQKQLKKSVSQYMIQCYAVYGFCYTTEAQRRELGEASQKGETLA